MGNNPTIGSLLVMWCDQVIMELIIHHLILIYDIYYYQNRVIGRDEERGHHTHTQKKVLLYGCPI